MLRFRFSLRRLRRHPLAWWSLVVAVAGAAGFLVTVSVASAEAAADRYDGLVNVAVAKKPLNAGTTVTASDVRTESRPRAFLSDADAVLSPVGRTVTAPVATGEVLTEHNVGGAGLSPTAALLTEHERAVALSLQGLHPELVIGDRVDVLATFETERGDAEPTVTVVEAARVVQLNDDSVMVAVPAGVSTRVAFAATKARIVLAPSSSTTPSHAGG